VYFGINNVIAMLHIYEATQAKLSKAGTKAAFMQGSIARGVMRWRLTVVRPCDMFWMGVTSHFGLDMSTMIANDRRVWMVSEEGTCIEHCRGAHFLQALERDYLLAVLVAGMLAGYLWSEGRLMKAAYIHMRMLARCAAAFSAVHKQVMLYMESMVHCLQPTL
jgi:hypothetical protein